MIATQDQARYQAARQRSNKLGFTGSMDFVADLELARAYLYLRRADAVQCYKEYGPFEGPIALAQHLARYW